MKLRNHLNGDTKNDHVPKVMAGLFLQYFRNE